MNYQEDDHIDRLGEMFELQGDLQRNTYGSHPGDITDPDERIQFYKDMQIALENELHEALDEIGWKPWATSKHFNEEAVQGELVDAWHFFMNLCMAANMTPETLFKKYKVKRLKNIKRQEDGYDGVDNKCPHCHRALDDDAVMCREVHAGDYDRWYLNEGDKAIQCSVGGGIYIQRNGEKAFHQVKQGKFGPEPINTKAGRGA